MAVVNEQIVTGRKFRKLIDEANRLWLRISFWTKACDVEFDDGKTAEIKLGAIDGITDSLASTSSRIAASAKSVATLNNTLNNRLAQQPNFIYDSTGKIIGYTTPGGADTVFPFKIGLDSVYKSVDLKNETNINNVKEITVDCRDIQGYAQYSDADFLVAPTSVYENHIGFSNTYTLDKVSWEYSYGILTIHNSTIGLGDAGSSQTLTMWYSSFDIYTR